MSPHTWYSLLHWLNSCRSVMVGGEGRIRTYGPSHLGSSLGRIRKTLRDRSIKPLSHLSSVISLPNLGRSVTYTNVVSLVEESAIALVLAFQRNDCIPLDIAVDEGRGNCGCGSCEWCMVHVPHACISHIAKSNVSDVRLTTSYIPPL